MGVPKFYRWISERYTKINEIVSDSALLPEFDHLYLDMNGIIHGCTHPSHMDVCDVLSERDMMLGIMHYLDRIISQIVKPKVSLYMAIDGVAPRAKLNQQRSRRFRSAKDLAEATKDMDKTDEGAKREVFDSNCITPGTEFMAKVSDTIKYFIRKKIKEDPIWRDLKVIFSGHEIPGEGEHKIMEHIRHMKSQPNYQPNTRHCIYGQDADLIMLGLVTHEPHFTILREVVDFTMGFKNKNSLKTVKKFTKESDFQLLHLSVLREYLQIEFSKISTGSDLPLSNSVPFDLERIIDDFVFMTFLVGNDFLPHLNTLDIGDGAFDLLFDVYKKQRQYNWGGEYLTYCGEISDAARLESFLEAIGSVETETLEQREKDDADYVKKKRKWNKRDGLPEGPSDAQLKEAEENKQQDYLTMLERVLIKHKTEGLPFVDGWKPVEVGEKDFKGRYYYEKLKLSPLDIPEHLALRKSYMEGLMWCLAYYYKGCISWGWFYPYHYGPMLSDLRNLPKMFDEIKFEIGAPLTPFQQLMGCLPPASAVLVPKPYRTLMSSPDSPIIQFYPPDFKVDMNGKKNPWEGVNLLPFIEVQLLKDSIATHIPDNILTPDERERNRKGKVYCYSFDLTCNDTIDSPNQKIGLADIVKCHSQVAVLKEPEMHGISFKPELIKGTRIPYPGFPSLNVLPIATVEQVPTGLNCFGMPSKYPNTILNLHQMPEIPPVEVLADNVLGKSLFINWPMMHEGKVAAISDSTCEVRIVKGKKKVKKFNQVELNRWATDSELMLEGYLKGKGVPGSGGVNIGEIGVRLKVLPLQGMKTNASNGSTKKLFGKEEADVPLQLALWQAPAPDPRFIERGPLTLQDRFPPTCNVILTKGKYRGCSGTVVGVADAKKVGVKVEIMPPELPFGLALARTVYESYITSVDASRILKLPPSLFGKITGSLVFTPGNYDLGLNLKSGDGMCVAGYSRQKKEPKDNKGKNGKGNNKKAWDAGDSLLVIGSARAPSVNKGDGGRDEKIFWEYTPKAIRLINEYRLKFPQLFNALVRQPNERKYDASKVFGPNGADWLPVIREWLNNVETAKLPRTPLSTEIMSQEAVAAVERASDVRLLALKKRGFPKESLIKIPGSALYRENSTGPTDIMLASDHNNDEAPEIGDRIVNLCASGIPFGARGTVIGIHQATTGCVEVVMDEEFVGGTTLQGACSNFRGKLCVWAHLLKISVENSKGLVDKLVPKGSGKAAVEKILSSIEKEVKNTDNKADEKAIIDKTEAAKAAPMTGERPSTARTPPRQPNQTFATAGTRTSSTPNPPRSGSANRSRTGSRGRAGSTGRGKQGAWREALGPAENGVGFSGGESVAKNGLTRWKEHINPSLKTKSKTSDSKGSMEKSAELKAMLGVSVGLPVPQQNPPVVAQMVGSNQPESDAAAGLKALLGVVPSVQPQQQPAMPVVDDGFPPPPPPPQPQPPAQPTAADKLLQLMSKQPPPQQHMQGPPMPGVSSFNFAYVDEGKEAPPPPNQPPPPSQQPMPPPPMAPMGFPPPPPPPVGMGMPMGPYGFMGPPPPMPMGMPHPGMHPMPHPPQMPLPPPQHQRQPQPQPQHQHQRQPNQFPRTKQQGGTPNVAPGPSLEDFPPLGSSPPKLVEETAEKDNKADKSEKKGSKDVEKNTPGLIIPAVVAAKGKK